MATQFTPGEWLVADRQPDRGHDYIFADNVVICEQPDPLAGRVAGDDWMQNRHLLAASKKLYAACEAAAKQFEYMLEVGGLGNVYPNADSECLTRLNTIRAALAAARGEVQP